MSRENENGVTACKIRVTKTISKQECVFIAALRREWFYDHPADPRYSKGGIHTLSTEDSVAAAYLKNKHGHFILAFLDNGDLVGYGRVSIISGGDRDLNAWSRNVPGAETLSTAACLHIVIVSRLLCGRTVSVEGRIGRLSHHLLNVVFDLARANKCQMVFCDVVTSPVKNDASIKLFAGEGFLEIGPSDILARGREKVGLSRFVKML